MAQQWPGVPVGGASAQPPAARNDPVIAPPNPYKRAAEGRAREDQAMEAERLRLQREAAARDAVKDRQTIAEKQMVLDAGPQAQAIEAERKAAAFLVRALGANESYEGLDTNPNDPGVQGIGPRSLVGQAVADTFPSVLNTLPAWMGNSPQRQVADTNQDEFIAASLRQDSGAAIPPEELERQRRIYFPMPGDGPEAIEAKRQARIRAIEGLRQSAGRLEGPAEERYTRLIEQLKREEEGDDLTGTFTEQGGFNVRVTDDRPAPNGPPPDGGGLNDIANAGWGNTAVGAAKGLAEAAYDFPMDVARTVRTGANALVGQGGAAALNALGLPDAADWWRQGSNLTQQNINEMPTAGGAIEAALPTPKGYETQRAAAEFIAPFFIPGAKGAPRITAPTEQLSREAAQEVVQAGKDAGVRVMTSDVRKPQTPTKKALRTAGERIPIFGTGGTRAKQQAERVEAVKEFAKEFGADVANDYLDEIADDLAKTRGGQITALSKAKDAVIDGIKGIVQTPRAVAEIDHQVAELSGINAEAYAPVIRELQAFKSNLLSGKSLRQIEENRDILGNLMADDNLAKIKTGGEKAIRAIYGPLRDDMAEFIKANAGQKAHDQWASANKRLSALAGELDSAAFKNVLKKTDTTPEQVSRLLFNKQPSEVRKLYSNLSPEGQAKARAGIIHMAIEKAGGIDEISPDKFANAIASVSKAAGVVFHGSDLKRLEGLQRVLQATKQAAVASAAPPTGVQNYQLTGAFAAGTVGPASLPLLVVGGGLARLYESAATRNLLIGLSKTKPGSKAEGDWLQRILKAASAQTDNMGAVANDIVANSPSRAAAQGENDPR